MWTQLETVESVPYAMQILVTFELSMSGSTFARSAWARELLRHVPYKVQAFIHGGQDGRTYVRI